MVELPEWSAFDAKAAPVLPEHAERPGRLVALVATTEARDDGWAIKAAVALVRAWSESGRRVVLADTALADATLHECFETDNTEGVTDTAAVITMFNVVDRVADATGIPIDPGLARDMRYAIGSELGMEHLTPEERASR